MAKTITFLNQYADLALRPKPYAAGEDDTFPDAVADRLIKKGVAYLAGSPRPFDPDDVVTVGELDNPGSPAYRRLAATYAPRGQALQPTPLAAPTTTAAQTLVPLETHGGYLWGADGTAIKRSSDGTTWTTVATAPGAPIRILWCDDGEVLVLTGDLHKSSGWATNPATATWSQVITRSAPAGPGIIASQIDGNGTKFIAAEYSGAADRSESRYVWVSTDAGTTWDVAYDDQIADPTGLDSHHHGVCYDPWDDRFWRSHGHGTLRGTYYSEDDGASWTMLGGDFQPDAAPFALCATDDGIVCGSDSADSGVYGIVRGVAAADMEMIRLARWRVTTDGIVGLASRAHRDPDTGLVWMTFQSDHANVAPAVAGGTARAAAFVYTYPTVGLRRAPAAVAFNDRLYISVATGGTYDRITGVLRPPGIAEGADGGNLRGGLSAWATSVAMGPTSESGGIASVVIGVGAATAAESSVAVGYNAQGTAARSVTVGRDTTVAADGIAIGHSADAAGLSQTILGAASEGYSGGTGAVVLGAQSAAGSASIAIGRNAKAGTTSGIVNAVAIGANTTAANNAVAIGENADAGSSQVAIGAQSAAAHANSVALGYQVATSAASQVAIGATHVEVRELAADPAAPAADRARWFVKDNGAGKTQLCVRFATGAVQVIATEP